MHVKERSYPKPSLLLLLYFLPLPPKSSYTNSYTPCQRQFGIRTARREYVKTIFCSNQLPNSIQQTQFLSLQQKIPSQRLIISNFKHTLSFLPVSSFFLCFLLFFRPLTVYRTSHKLFSQEDCITEQATA